MRPDRKRKGFFKVKKIIDKWKSIGVFDHSHGEEHLQNTERKFLKTRTPCSCFLCCNPRHSKFFKRNSRITLQEQKEEISYNEQLKEIKNDE